VWNIPLALCRAVRLSCAVSDLNEYQPRSINSRLCTLCHDLLTMPRTALFLFRSGVVIARAGELDDLRKGAGADPRSEYGKRIETLESRVVELTAERDSLAQVEKRLSELKNRAQTHASETVERIEQAQALAPQNKAASKRASATPVFDKTYAGEQNKAFEFHGRLGLMTYTNWSDSLRGDVGGDAYSNRSRAYRGSPDGGFVVIHDGAARRLVSTAPNHRAPGWTKT
jgi:hypothetical protein